jgi:hypothetical protein
VAKNRVSASAAAAAISVGVAIRGSRGHHRRLSAVALAAHNGGTAGNMCAASWRALFRVALRFIALSWRAALRHIVLSPRRCAAASRKMTSAKIAAANIEANRNQP